MYKQGAIVLVPIPFTDLSSARRRPVIVISNDNYNRTTVDIVVVAMTSVLKASPYSFLVTSADLTHGSLNKPSRVRVDKLYTLDQRLVTAHFGTVNASTLDRIRQLLVDLTRP